MRWWYSLKVFILQITVTRLPRQRKLHQCPCELKLFGHKDPLPWNISNQINSCSLELHARCKLRLSKSSWQQYWSSETPLGLYVKPTWWLLTELPSQRNFVNAQMNWSYLIVTMKHQQSNKFLSTWTSCTLHIASLQVFTMTVHPKSHQACMLNQLNSCSQGKEIFINVHVNWKYLTAKICYHETPTIK